MKRFLSILLAMATAYSTVSFAAPVLTQNTNSAAEITQLQQSSNFTQGYTASEDENGTLVYNLDFDSAAVSYLGESVSKYGTVKLCEGFPDEVSTGLSIINASAVVENGKIKVTSNSGAYARIKIRNEAGFPEGRYLFSLDMNNTSAKNNYLCATLEGAGSSDAGLVAPTIKAGEAATVAAQFDYLNGVAAYGDKNYSYTSLQALSFYSDKLDAAYELDNFKVYYTPAVTVSFNTGVSGMSASPKNVIAGESFNMSDAPSLSSMGTNTFLGWSLTENGDAVTDEEIVVDGDITLYALWSQPVTEESIYGTLVYSFDFEGKSGTIGGEAAEYGYANLPEGFPSSSEITLTTNFDSAQIADGKLTLTATNTLSYPLVKRIQLISSGASFPEGEYFVSLEMENPASNGDGLYSCLSVGGTNEWGLIAPTIANGSKGTVEAQFTYSDGVITYGNATKDYSSFEYIFAYTAISGTKTISYDNIKVYYKPVSKVSFDGNGCTDEKLSAVSLGKGSTINLDSYAFANTEDYIFLGWQDAEGNIVSGEVTVNEHVTYTARWLPVNDEENGSLVYYIHFNGINGNKIGGAAAEYGFAKLPEGFPASSEITLTTTFDSAQIADGRLTLTATNTSKSLERIQLVSSGASFPEGEYFVSLEMENPASNGENLYSCLSVGGTSEWGLVAPTIANGSKGTVEAQFTYSDGVITYGSNSKAYPSFTYIYAYTEVGGTKSVSYDNIKVYYKPVSKVKVSFADTFGYALELPSDVSIEKGGSLNISDFTLTSNDESMIFEGWSLTENGDAVDEAVISQLEESITLYAVWSHKIIPMSYSKNSIRVNEPSGIRFMSSVHNSVRSDANTTEYGFIVTLASHLNGKSANELTFEQQEIPFVWGINYGYEDNKKVDIIFENDGEKTIFTAVIHGIKPEKSAYEEKLVVRPYIKYNGETLYGNAMSRSLLEVAISYRDNDYNGLDEEKKKIVTEILDICGEKA